MDSGRPATFPLILTRATPETEWTIPPPRPKIPPMAANANPNFEVATIKPNDSGAATMQGLNVNGRNFRTVNSSLGDLIQFAYEVQAKQIVNGPDWMRQRSIRHWRGAGGRGCAQSWSKLGL